MVACQVLTKSWDPLDWILNNWFWPGIIVDLIVFAHLKHPSAHPPWWRPRLLPLHRNCVPGCFGGIASRFLKFPPFSAGEPCSRSGSATCQSPSPYYGGIRNPLWLNHKNLILFCVSPHSTATLGTSVTDSVPWWRKESLCVWAWPGSSLSCKSEDLAQNSLSH